jgi:hypothetical protein
MTPLGFVLVIWVALALFVVGEVAAGRRASQRAAARVDVES